MVLKKLSKKLLGFSQKNKFYIRIFTGVMILVPLLIVVSISLIAVQTSQDVRKQAAPYECQMCDGSCISEYEMCPDLLPSDDDDWPDMTCKICTYSSAASGCAIVDDPDCGIEPIATPTATPEPSPTLTPDQQACSDVGGTWEIFNNGCVDSCYLVLNPGAMCTQAMTAGCNCGASQCWDGDTCVDNPIPTATPEPSPTLTPDQQSCSDAGGTWQFFSNSCVDGCTLVLNPGATCLQAITPGCNCGASQCWDGDTCVDNPIATPTPTATPEPSPTLTPDQQSCSDAGGTWQFFNNSCVDSCTLVLNPGAMCLQAITPGCNCGASQCWDGDTCVDNPIPTADPTTPPCAFILTADFNNTGTVDEDDYNILISTLFGFRTDIALVDISGPDGNPDGFADLWDYAELVNQWGQTCPGTPTHTPLPPPP